MAASAQNVVSGLRWVALITYSNRVLGFVTTLVLAKVLAPEDFGLVAVASMLIEVLRILKDAGFSEALIYQKRDDGPAIDTAHTVLVGMNVVLFLLAAGLAPLAASFYESAVLTPVIILLSSNLVWDAARAVPRALTRKAGQFHRLVLPEVIPVVASSAVSIWMAVTGFGVWSLVAKTLIHSLFGAVLMGRLLERPPRFRFDGAAARDLFHYGKFIAGTTILLVALYNIDRFYVSRVAGIAALGAFELAMRLVEMPVKEFSFIIGSVMFPVFARTNRDDGSLARALFRTLKYTGLVSVPMALGIVVYGPTLIRTFYGARWEPTIVPMQVLAGYALLRSFSSIIYDAFKGMGRPDVMMRFTIFKLLAIGVFGVPALINYGLVGIATLIAATYAVTFVMELWTITRLLRVDLLSSAGLMIRPLVASAVAIPGVYLAWQWWHGIVSSWHLAVIIPLTMLLHLASVWTLDPQVVRDLRRLAGSR